MKSTFHAHQSLVLDSVAVCSFIDKREIGIFFFYRYQITRLRRDCEFFPRIRGLFMSEISRDRVEKFHSLFIGSSLESWMAQKERKKKKRVWGCFMRIINWILDELLNDSSIMNIFLIIRETRNFFFFFFTSISLNKKLQFRISRNDLAHKTTYIQHFLSKELALICFFILRKYFELLSQWQSIVQL